MMGSVAPMQVVGTINTSMLTQKRREVSSHGVPIAWGYNAR